MEKKHINIFAIVVISLATFFIVYDYFIQIGPSVIAQQLMASFNIGAAKLGVLGACFFFGYTVMQLPAGWLIDHYGVRRCLSLAVFVSGCGVTLFAFSHTLWGAGASRLLVGCGSAFAFLGGLYIASHWFTHERFALVAGILQLGSGVGAIIGEAPLAALVHSYGWRESMSYIGVFTFILAVIFYLVMRDQRKKLSNEKTYRFREVLNQKQVWWIALCNFITWMPAGTVGALWGVPYIMRVFNMSNVEAAELFMIFWVAVGFMAPGLGWISGRLKRRRPILFVIFVVGFVSSLFMLYIPHLSKYSVIIILFLLGIPAAGQCIAFATLKDNVRLNQYTTASAICNMASVLSGALGQPLMGALIQWHWSGQRVGGIPYYSIHNFQVGYTILPIAMLVGMLVTWLGIKETYCMAKTNIDEGL